MALAERFQGHGGPSAAPRSAEAEAEGGVVLGEDWIRPESAGPGADARRRGLGRFSLTRSPLTRKIVTFNLVALNILVAGILFLNGSGEDLHVERLAALETSAELVADVFEAQLPRSAPVNLAAGDGLDAQEVIDGLDLRRGLTAVVFDTARRPVAQGSGGIDPLSGASGDDDHATPLIDALTFVWSALTGLVSSRETAPPAPIRDQLAILAGQAIETGGTVRATGTDADGSTVHLVATPIFQGQRVVAAVGLAGAAREVDAAIRARHESMLRMFVIATLVSIGLSLVLASTISNPLNELATAAELGRSKGRAGAAGRVRIPDLTARPDEIGRLSAALREMVAALYDRIEANEQFAADVAHEIKNPLASLRSAVGTLRHARREDQKAKLLEVIEHDVRRLDRLVSDISNASRLDSELVREEEEPFNLNEMLGNICQFLGEDADRKGITFITDLPKEPIVIRGLEARLAQVFVNLITNAISFCEPGDAIRVWARKRDNRVLVVVEDTGIGIPEEALTKIFRRFYSERPPGDFGNNSGLGLAISKQIVEAHGGVIWAENIRPTDADPTSEPIGARFVVGLPA